MAIEQRSLHLRLQEFCDCYMETDYKTKLEEANREGERLAGEWEELALRFLALAVMYGTTVGAKRFSLARSREGAVRFQIEANGTYPLPAPPAKLADEIFAVLRSITHLDAPRASEPLSLGLRNDRLELTIAFDTENGEEHLTVSFPSS